VWRITACPRLRSMLPPVFSQAMMAGQGLAGVTAGVAELVVLAAVKNTVRV